MKKVLFLSLAFFIITNPVSASYRHITCAMVRSFVAERGFAETGRSIGSWHDKATGAPSDLVSEVGT
jgi:hypothetical protein